MGLACDGADGDLCLEGTRACAGGALVCNDLTPTTVELCNGDGADEDCDGAADEGFERNDNPACAASTVNLGPISGDTGNQMVQASRYDEEWYRVRITEDSSSTIYLSATIQLTSPVGTDFDLFVYCANCGGTLAGSSTIGGTNGHTDTVLVRANDEFGVVDDFDVIIEVRHWLSNLCANWTLTVRGNTIVGSATCN